MQIGKALINDHVRVPKVFRKYFAFQLFLTLQLFTRKILYFLKK